MPAPARPVCATGIPGLDEVLNGGLPKGHLYLVQGQPGTGKTTLGLQFLIAGRDLGETGLLVVLSETKEEVEEIAASHGHHIDGIHVHTMSAAEASALLDNRQTLFHSADIELDEITTALIEVIHELKPDRIVVDSIAEIRLLAESPMRYRRQVLALKQVMAKLGTTALFTDSIAQPYDNIHMQELAHGVIELERVALKYGNVRRHLQVAKLRGSHFANGYHDFSIQRGGLVLYPRLAVPRTQGHNSLDTVSSSVAEIDDLLGGGLGEGTACLIQGAAGTGKTTLCSIYVYAALTRGERAAIFLFDERPETFFQRAQGMGFDLQPFVGKGTLHVHRIDAGNLSPGEFAHTIRTEVEEHQIKIVVIDSLSGYYHGIPEHPPLITQLHEILTYNSHRGVLSLLISTQHGVLEADEESSMAMSYLADTVILLRHFEAFGRLRKAISVLKKRHGHHENTIRELQLTSEGLKIGDPLTAFRGVLTGLPEYTGAHEDLLTTEPPPPDGSE